MNPRRQRELEVDRDVLAEHRELEDERDQKRADEVHDQGRVRERATPDREGDQVPGDPAGPTGAEHDEDALQKPAYSPG
jgi:hypothetical protein